MDFARGHLESLGWRDGAGLGRREQGRSTPLRVSIKRDTAGVGCAPAAGDFSDTWWRHVYDRAAQRVDNGDGVNTVLPAAVTRHSVYRGFVSAGFLHNTGAEEQTDENAGEQDLSSRLTKSTTSANCGGTRTRRLSSSSSSSSSSDEEERDGGSSVYDDEDARLLKACGGRTAHSAARHGLCLSGKLARLEQQESAAAAKIRRLS